MKLFNRKPVWDDRIRQARLPRDHSWRSIVVVSSKGGAGKTTVSTMIALQLAELRNEQVCFIDANPHTGTARRRLTDDDDLPRPLVDLAQHVIDEHEPLDARSLPIWTDRIGRLLAVTNAGVDPGRAERMSGNDYQQVLDEMLRHAQLVVTDTGTSIASNLAFAALTRADHLVVTTTMAEDYLVETIEHLSALCGEPISWSPEAELSEDMTDGRWLPLVQAATVVVNPPVTPRHPRDLAAHISWLQQVCRQVVVVPPDRHLASGVVIDQALTSPATRHAYREIAAHVMEA